MRELTLPDLQNVSGTGALAIGLAIFGGCAMGVYILPFSPYIGGAMLTSLFPALTFGPTVAILGISMGVSVGVTAGAICGYSLGTDLENLYNS